MGQALEGLQNQGVRTPNSQSPHWVPWNSWAVGLGSEEATGLIQQAESGSEGDTQPEEGALSHPWVCPSPARSPHPAHVFLRPGITCPNPTLSFPHCEMGSMATAMHGCLGQKVTKSTGGSGAQCPATGRLQEGSSEAMTQSWAWREGGEPWAEGTARAGVSNTHTVRVGAGFKYGFQDSAP